MSTRKFDMVFVGGDTQTLPGGIFFLIANALSAITIRTRLRTSASPTEFVGVGAGLSYGPVDNKLRWDYIDITSAAAQAVSIIISDDAEIKVGNVVSVSGSVSTLITPSTALTDTADTAQAINTQTAISGNATRRRITIGVLSTAGNGVRVSQAGGAGRGIEVQPGTFSEFDTIGALIVRNTDVAASGAASTWYAEEES